VTELRASDADRERTVAALRHHAAVGRLSSEELEHRCRRAHAAATVGELAALQADLPSLATRPARRRHGLAPGWRGFTSRWHTPVGAELTMAELIAHLAPAIQERGFDLIQRADDRLRFERRRRPGWTWAVAIVPVFGWFALLHKKLVRITIDVAETDRGTQLVASGVAPLGIRRTFAELED
jgi:GNAT superfamily N-acetyltransferase